MSPSGMSRNANTTPGDGCNAAVVRAVVVTVRVAVAVPLPGLTDAGLNEQAAAGGTPEVQENDTLPVKPDDPSTSSGN